MIFNKILKMDLNLYDAWKTQSTGIYMGKMPGDKLLQ